MGEEREERGEREERKEREERGQCRRAEGSCAARLARMMVWAGGARALWGGVKHGLGVDELGAAERAVALQLRLGTAVTASAALRALLSVAEAALRALLMAERALPLRVLPWSVDATRGDGLGERSHEEGSHEEWHLDAHELGAYEASCRLSSALCRKCSCEAREPERGVISLSASRTDCVEPPSIKCEAKGASSGGTSFLIWFFATGAGGTVGPGSLGDEGSTERALKSAAPELTTERALAGASALAASAA